MKAFRISLKDLIPLPILILTAYGGGLFFGQHPEFFRRITGAPTLILGTTGGLSETALQWLQDQQSFPIEVRVLERPSSLELIGVDVLWIPSSEASELREKFQEPSEEIRRAIDLNLVRTTDRALPVLWKISPGPSGRPVLSRWMIADLSGKKQNRILIKSFFESEFHALLLRTLPGFSSSLKELLTTSEREKLIETPLQNLEI